MAACDPVECERRGVPAPQRQGVVMMGGETTPLSEHEISPLELGLRDDGIREWASDAIEGHPKLLTVSCASSSLRVCAGVARRFDDSPYSEAEVLRLSRLTSVISDLLRLYQNCWESEQADVIHAALRDPIQAWCAVDLAARRVLTVCDRQEGQPCLRAISQDEQGFLALVERLKSAPRGDDEEPASLGSMTIVRLAELGESSAFDDARSIVVVALRHTGHTDHQLSSRECQIARLLARGYSNINVAAILSLSENTVRTHVRRLYRKLEVTNRADLTRRCSDLGLA